MSSGSECRLHALDIFCTVESAPLVLTKDRGLDAQEGNERTHFFLAGSELLHDKVYSPVAVALWHGLPRICMRSWCGEIGKDRRWWLPIVYHIPVILATQTIPTYLTMIRCLWEDS